MSSRKTIAAMSLVDIQGDFSLDEHGSGTGPSPEGLHPKADDVAAVQGLSDHTQKRIGLHLRAMYDTIVQQPVPDRFRDLIAKLDASAPNDASDI